MAFDPTDRYHVHAYFSASFHCADCGGELPLPVGGEPTSDAWCIEFADRARSAGWYVPGLAANGDFDIVTTYCPQCRVARGLPDPAV